MIHTYKSSFSSLFRSAFLPKLMIATCFIINFFNPRLLQAQEVQKPAETKSAVHLNEKQWKEFEGIFQSSNNKEMYVQLSDGENMLVAKLLWNNNVMHL